MPTLRTPFSGGELFGVGAQVVLAHQAVEVDRRGGAGIGLVVRDVGLLAEQRARGPLSAATRARLTGAVAARSAASTNSTTSCPRSSSGTR